MQVGVFSKANCCYSRRFEYEYIESNSGEGKILSDLGELNNLHCIVNEPTRITAHSKSLLDVILHEYS